MITESFAQALVNEDSDGEGVACQFYRLTPDIGVKFYRDEDERDKSWALQKIGHALDIAPNVYEKFEIETSDEYNLYAYATELAVTIYDILTAQLGFAPYSDWYESNGHGWYCHVDYNYIRQYIREKFNSANIDTADLHDKNIGFGPNGELWCIDFSEFDIDIDDMSWEEFANKTIRKIRKHENDN